MIYSHNLPFLTYHFILFIIQIPIYPSLKTGFVRLFFPLWSRFPSKKIFSIAAFVSYSIKNESNALNTQMIITTYSNAVPTPSCTDWVWFHHLRQKSYHGVSSHAQRFFRFCYGQWADRQDWNAHQKQYKTSRDYEYYIRPLIILQKEITAGSPNHFAITPYRTQGRKRNKGVTRKHTASTAVMAASRSAPPR